MPKATIQHAPPHRPALRPHKVQLTWPKVHRARTHPPIAQQANDNKQLVMWQKRYERAKQLYASYRDSTRYPFDSRPIARHPRSGTPFRPD